MGDKEKYEYLKREITGQNRHQFIYGYNTDMRKQFVQEIDTEFPVRMDCDIPISIYVEDIGLPSVDTDTTNLKQDKISIVSSEFLNFSIIHSILLKTMKNLDTESINTRFDHLLNYINRCCRNKDYPNIYNIEELTNIIIESKEFYEEYYYNLLTCKDSKSIEGLIVPFIDVSVFTSHYKKSLNNDSYLNIIIDKNKDIATYSMQAINSLVGSRINKNTSMKIIVEPSMWGSYYDRDGNIVQSVHDYGIVELDDSHSEYIKKLKYKNNI